MTSTVQLVCVKQGSRLRVRITTPGYLTTANVQFPRDLRVEGRRYEMPANAVTLVYTRSKYYYSATSKSSIKIIEEVPTIDTANITVYEDTESTDCAICFAVEKSVVFYPCGHFYTCGDCSNRITNCPICRVQIQARIDRSLVQ